MDQNQEPKRIFTLLLLSDIVVMALTSYSENQPQGLQLDPDRGIGAPHLKTFSHGLLPGAFPESFGVAGAQGSSSGLHFPPTEMCGALHTAQLSEQIEAGAVSYGKRFLVTKAQTASWLSPRPISVALVVISVWRE